MPIRNCTCVDYKGNTQGANYQDAKYGIGNRVHVTVVDSNSVRYRCTICGKTAEHRSPQKDEKAEKVKGAKSSKKRNPRG